MHLGARSGAVTRVHAHIFHQDPSGHAIQEDQPADDGNGIAAKPRRSAPRQMMIGQLLFGKRWMPSSWARAPKSMVLSTRCRISRSNLEARARSGSAALQA